MRLWTADTHFFHENIIRFCNRPYEDVDMMHRGMKHIWNEHVYPDDTIYILGDYAFKPATKLKEIVELTSELEGYKIVSGGNHDTTGFLLRFGIDTVVSGGYVKIGGVNMKFAHFSYPDAMTENDKTERPDCFTPIEYDKSTGQPYPLLCGHVHDEFLTSNGCLNVGWDVWHRPVTDRDIENAYQKTDGFKKFTRNLQEMEAL